MDTGFAIFMKFVCVCVEGRRVNVDTHEGLMARAGLHMKMFVAFVLVRIGLFVFV